MALQDTETYTLGLPYRHFQPNEMLYNLTHGLHIGLDRQIWGNSTDVRFARACVVSAFLNDATYANSNVLVFYDQDTIASASHIENLVINCSEQYPVIGSNMVYRGGQQENNWYLKDDPNCIKKKSILSDYSQRNAFISVRWAGFGLIALHRTLLEKMADVFGLISCGGMQVPNIFSEVHLNDCLPWEIAGPSLKSRLRPVDVELTDEQWDKIWSGMIEEAVQFRYKAVNKTMILPETYSFCERVQELGKEIIVHLGVRPGHLEEITTYAEGPPLAPSKDLMKTIALRGDDIYSSSLKVHQS